MFKVTVYSAGCNINDHYLTVELKTLNETDSFIRIIENGWKASGLIKCDVEIKKGNAMQLLGFHHGTWQIDKTLFPEQ